VGLRCLTASSAICRCLGPHTPHHLERRTADHRDSPRPCAHGSPCSPRIRVLAGSSSPLTGLLQQVFDHKSLISLELITPELQIWEAHGKRQANELQCTRRLFVSILIRSVFGVTSTASASAGTAGARHDRQLALCQPFRARQKSCSAPEDYLSRYSSDRSSASRRRPRRALVQRALDTIVSLLFANLLGPGRNRRVSRGRSTRSSACSLPTL
jgi:hypothetical protein